MTKMGPSLGKAVEHHRAGEWDRAIALYRHALRGSPIGLEAARAWGMLGAALRATGRFEQAEEALRSAVRAEGGAAIESRRALADLLGSQSKMDEAVAVWRAGIGAAGLGPGGVEAALGMGLQLAAARRTAEALAHITALAAAVPGHLLVRYELGRLSERLGRREEARAALEVVLAAAPDMPEANMLMARLDAAAGQAPVARARLERLLGTVTDARRGAVLIELATLLDKAGEYAAAFEMAQRGQAANFAALPPGRRDGALHERVIGMGMGITAADVERWGGESSREVQGTKAEPSPQPPPSGRGSQSPIFIVGFPRSGTTLLEQMLAAHPRLAVTDEAPVLQRAREKMYWAFRPRGNYPKDLGEFTADQVGKARGWYLERAGGVVGGGGEGRRVVDKQPLNTVDMCLARLILPESSVVFVSRDPRDTVLSCFMQGFARGVPHLFTLEGTARLYDLVMGLWEHYKAVLGQRWIEVQYEELVRDPEGQVRRVLEFVGEGWDERVLRSHEAAHRRYVTTPSYADVARPVYTGAVGRWRRYEKELGPVMGVLGRWIDKGAEC